jgi:hypothetical protein
VAGAAAISAGLPDPPSQPGGFTTAGILDLSRIEKGLLETRRFMKHRISENTTLDRPDRQGIARMMAGYGFVDELLKHRVDLFAPGNSDLFLELNALVLCGDDPEVRESARRHLRETERRFYDSEPPGGIRDIVEWYHAHKREPARVCAAGVYIRVLSEPELFIEGNHRTGVLIMGYLLARRGLPPFVLSPSNVDDFAAWSTRFSARRKTSAYRLLEMPWLKRRFANFIYAHEDAGYLLRQYQPHQSDA